MSVAIGPLLPILKEAALKVAYAMSDRRNWQNFDDGNITVTFGRLAIVAGLSDEKYARQGVAQLAENGIIEIVKPATRGRFGAGIYRVVYTAPNESNRPYSETPVDPNIGSGTSAEGPHPITDNLSDQKTVLKPVESGSIRADKQAELRSNCRDGAIYSLDRLQSTEYREEAPPAGNGFEKDADELEKMILARDVEDPNDPAVAGPRPLLHRRPQPLPADQADAQRSILDAVNRWALQHPPRGQGFEVDPTMMATLRPIRQTLDELAAEPDIPRGNQPVRRVLLIPQAIYILSKRGRPFESVAYTLAAARGMVRQWANAGVPAEGDQQNATTAPPWKAQLDKEILDDVAKMRELRRQRDRGTR